MKQYKTFDTTTFYLAQVIAATGSSCQENNSSCYYQGKFNNIIANTCALLALMPHFLLMSVNRNAVSTHATMKPRFSQRVTNLLL